MTDKDLETENERDAEIGRIQLEQLSIDKLTFILNRSQFRFNIVTGIIVAIGTVLVSIFTAELYYSTDAMKISAFSQIRPYLMVQGIDVKYANNDIDSNISVKNYGVTPAFDMYTESAETIILHSRDASEAFTYTNYSTDCSKDSGHAASVLLAQNDAIDQTPGKYSVGYTSDQDIDRKTSIDVDHLSPRDIDLLKSKKAILLTNGLICYKDIFQNQHYTRFCRFFEYSDVIANRRMQGKACEHENDAN